ncbi:hypothetical protein JMA_06420 [Jeotgalibacillus malaysiensis]|uniref:DUF4306 domain-containing protein n=1 Tax=Jeotgalibacillus malaysiensis TaxID=1508404 RepID=A0A0B5APF2_9BACL|nr:DUF4306 domain-containing protein [Jeotgalibacillus malaysiensis]AJD89959.1 hypothetical protein JMA_06420 [Jeotgalibacillus malaysiensis]
MKWFSAQLSVAITLLALAAAGTWYEGSAIRDHSFEWAYSTPFSHLIHGEVLQVSQISSLDHFVYAAKFQPALPLVMTISALYAVFLITYRVVKHDLKKWITGLVLLMILSLTLGLTLANSPTPGGTAFSYFFIGLGVISSVLTVTGYFLMSRSPEKEVIQ